MVASKKNRKPVLPRWDLEDLPDPPAKRVVKASPKHALAVSMIPVSNWSKNVRGVVARDIWNAMRYYFQATKERPDYMRALNLPYPDWRSPISCQCCGDQRDNLELHEVWDFDDTALIQRLTAFVPICDRCHNVIHFGRASQLGLADEAFEHLKTVNGLSKTQATKHIEDAYAIWTKRSAQSYTVDMEYLKEFLPNGHIHLGWLDKPRFWRGNRLDAIAWAKGHLATGDAVIVDTETTGLISGPNKNPHAEVIELAVIGMNGKVLYQSRFRPKHKVPKRTTEIHGISDDDLVDCPTFLEVHPKILEILSGRTAISYNDRFDSGVIAQTCSMFKLEPPNCRWECAMRMYRAFIESARFVKLPGAKHGAVADCKATLRLIKTIAKG